MSTTPNNGRKKREKRVAWEMLSKWVVKILFIILVAPIIWCLVGIIGYLLGRLMWNLRPKDGVEGPNKFWNQFSVFDKKYMDEI